MDPVSMGVIGGSALLGVAGQAGLFGKPKQFGYSKGDIDFASAQREREISSFSDSLAQMRADYLSKIPGMQSAAFDRFSKDNAANFGARGLGVDSGAFASSLAREAIPMQANMYGTAFSTGTADLNAVNAARASAFNARMGAMGPGLAQPTQNPAWAGLGNFAGNAAMMAYGQYLRPGATPGAPGPGLPGNWTPGLSGDPGRMGRMSEPDSLGILIPPPPVSRYAPQG